MNVTVFDAAIAVVVVAVALTVFGLVLSRFKVEWATIMTILAGIVGIGLLMIFLGIMLWWVQALPLIIIVVVVVALVIHDWIKTIRFGESGTSR